MKFSQVPIILATQERERIAVQSHPGQIVCETYLETPKRTGGVVQGVSLNSSFSTTKKENEK
jgi:hypothetical protein